MEFDFIICFILLAAFGFAYASKFCRLKKINIVWTIFAVICVGMATLVILMRGFSMLRAALDLSVLAVAICYLDGKKESGLHAI